MLGRMKKDGRPLREKAEDKIWKDEFAKMTLGEHNDKLRELGLEDEDLKEFDEKFAGMLRKKK